MDFRNYTYSPDILRDRIVLVTGATEGVGRALAVHAAELGARVILHGRNAGKLESVYDEIEAQPGALRPSIAVLDLAIAGSDEYAALRDSIEQEFGRLDALVHNAAMLGSRLSIEQYDPAEWQRVLHVNLTAPFVLTQALLPLLKRSDAPSIVFTSSGVGRVAKPFWGAYAVSKFGIEALAGMLAGETGHTALRVNAVNPGPVRTAMRLAAYPAEDRDKVPAPRDILGVYVYLLGPDGRAVHGQSLDAQS